MNRFASSLVLLIVTAGVSPGTGAAQDAPLPHSGRLTRDLVTA